MLKYNIEVKVWSEKNLTKCVAAGTGRRNKHPGDNDTSRKNLVIFNDGAKPMWAEY